MTGSATVWGDQRLSGATFAPQEASNQCLRDSIATTQGPVTATVGLQRTVASPLSDKWRATRTSPAIMRLNLPLAVGAVAPNADRPRLAAWQCLYEK